MFLDFRKMICALLTGVLLLSAGLSYAQTKPLLRFEEPSRDLGVVDEMGGLVRMKFKFQNISDKPVALIDIHSQCGCFSPAWSAEPVKPGGIGVVEAVFDPKGRSGDFMIGLTVISTNGDYNRYNTLKISGTVKNHVPEEEIYYPYELSSVFRADLKAVGMRLFEPGDGPRQRKIKLYNTTSKVLELKYIAGSKAVEINGPESVPSHTEAVIIFEVDPDALPPGAFTLPVRIVTGKVETVIELRGQVNR